MPPEAIFRSVGLQGGARANWLLYSQVEKASRAKRMEWVLHYPPCGASRRFAPGWIWPWLGSVRAGSGEGFVAIRPPGRFPATVRDPAISSSARRIGAQKPSRRPREIGDRRRLPADKDEANWRRNYESCRDHSFPSFGARLEHGSPIRL